MGFLIAFLALFLLVLAAAGFAAIKLFGARDAQGQLTPSGVVLGCLTGLALAFIGTLGLAAFVGGVFAISTADSFERVARSVPDFTVRAWRDPRASVHLSPGHPLHIVLQWKGHSEPTEWLLREIGKIEPDSEILVHVDYQSVPSDDADVDQDEQVTVVDLAFPADSHDLDELEEALREMLPDLTLSHGIEIEIKSAYREELR